MSLRSLADTGEELEEALASGEVQAPKTGDPTAEKKMLATLAARPSDRASTYSTGADVSRYQRSSVPGKPVDPNALAQKIAAGNGGPGLVPVVHIARGTQVTTVEVGSK